MSVIKVNEENFEEEVLQSEKPVLVDFFAEWCGPCKMLSPVVDSIAEEMPQIKVCKIDIDDSIELAQQYRVMSVPTLLIFQNGKVIDQSVGVIPRERILEMLP